MLKVHTFKQTFKQRILQVCERTENRLGHMDEGMKQAAGFTLHIYIAVHHMTF